MKRLKKWFRRFWIRREMSELELQLLNQEIEHSQYIKAIAFWEEKLKELQQ